MAVLAYWPPAGHLALVAACLAVAWWRFETAPVAPPGSTQQGVPVAPGPATSSGVEDSGGQSSEADVEAVASRALFRPGRLVAPTEAASAPVAAEEAPPSVSATFRMTGYFDLGDRRSAILETVEDGQSQVVNEGDEFAGATVREISPEAVVIETADGQVTVLLNPD